MRFQRTLLIVLVLMCFSSATVFGQLGGLLGGLGGILGGLGGAGIPVSDSALISENLIHTAKFTAHLQQLIQTYDRITDQYKHMQFQAKQLKGRVGRYNTPTNLWKPFVTSNSYGTAGPWIQAVNSGVGVAGGWQKATTMMQLYPSGFGDLPASQRDRRAVDVAGLELADGAAMATMETVGLTRAGGVKLDRMLQVIEQDVLDEDNEQNTEAAQLNKLNALTLVSAKATNDQNRLLLSLNEQGLIRLRQEREAAAYALQNDAAFRREGKQNIESLGHGFSDAMRSFRY